MNEQLSLWPSETPPAPAVHPARAYQKSPRKLLTIRELPPSERPVSRLHRYGPSALSSTELLAILIGTPHQLQDAAALLAAFDDLVGVARACSAELQRLPGIGATAAARIKAAFELGQRLAVGRPADRVQIRSPADAANLLMPKMGLLEQEHLRVILLDTRNRVVAVPTIYVGSVNTTMIRVSELFREAIRRNCPALIAVHNHPSGDVSPSPEDISVTKQLVEAGRLMDIEVLDHLIVSRTAFVSLKERGLGFS